MRNKHVTIPLLSLLCLVSALPVRADEGGMATGAGGAGAPVESVSASGEAPGMPIERAKGEKLATAIGHYARARSLLIAAVNEFDRGLKLVDPSALVDVGVFRTTLIDRADELQRVLDPQPRATKTGIKFQGDSRLLGEAKR